MCGNHPHSDSLGLGGAWESAFLTSSQELWGLKDSDLICQRCGPVSAFKKRPQLITRSSACGGGGASLWNYLLCLSMAELVLRCVMFSGQKPRKFWVERVFLGISLPLDNPLTSLTLLSKIAFCQTLTAARTPQDSYFPAGWPWPNRLLRWASASSLLIKESRVKCTWTPGIPQDTLSYTTTGSWSFSGGKFVIDGVLGSRTGLLGLLLCVERQVFWRRGWLRAEPPFWWWSVTPSHSQLGAASWKASASKPLPGPSFGPQGISAVKHNHRKIPVGPQLFSKTTLARGGDEDICKEAESSCGRISSSPETGTRGGMWLSAFPGNWFSIFHVSGICEKQETVFPSHSHNR